MFSILGKNLGHELIRDDLLDDEWSPDKCATPCDAIACDCGGPVWEGREYLEEYSHSYTINIQLRYQK